MDHMRISGTEPSSLILSQSSLKYEEWCQKVQKQGKAKRDGVINTPKMQNVRNDPLFDNRI